MNNEFNARLVNFLSASETRSGEAISKEMGCSRTAVWKHIEALREMGVGVDALAGQGYRLLEPLELLNGDRIRSHLEPEAESGLNELVLLPSVDSTNSWIQSQPTESQPGTAVFAESQSAGRGRRGQQWVSPFGRNIYFSVGWRFESGAGELACLPLLLALCACEALDRVGLQGHGVKWPNDLLVDDRKLGGCLVEVQGDVSGPCMAVLGVGINVRMPASTPEAEHIDQAWTDVASRVPGISRNRLAGKLLNSSITRLNQFARDGFEPFAGDWAARDMLAGKDVNLKLPSGPIRGPCMGISPRGGLLIQNAKGVGEYMAGEASVVRKDS